MRALLIVNPRATSTTPGVRDVIAHAVASRAEVTLVETSYRGHATDLGARARADGFDVVVAHGGDGTVNEIVNGLAGDTEPVSGSVAVPHPAAPAVAIVPGGSANVFARALGLPSDPLEATHVLLEALAHWRTRRIGLGAAGGRLFTFSAGLGWDADVVAGVDRIRGKQAGPALYTRVAATRYFRPPLGRPSLAIEVPGDEEATARSVFVCNTDPWSYLGSRPIRLAPGCSFDTGLAVIGLRSLGVPSVLKHLAGALSNRGLRHARGVIRYADVAKFGVRAEEPVNVQVDGDYVGTASMVDFTSVPDALTVLA
ncbi:diacylglycerol kinase family lipid kinase [Haloechinothrix sp. LS1_15]|uniref:diacylglycerol/lipid kinase family protein n=1 Tax=Haloechinothrix sp. LS1_15 TaxID=2652248 RepID=UPI0029474AB6|nr:diacylglycerol kinase family lipid kinase [Haloechinothrix sp. LS1_15]MDV6011590.1 diacylglycerol kinase family lipid kinase [Haloechinothrix sp. LS1_15]